MWLFTMYIFFKLCPFVLLTLSPSLILFTFARSPSLSKSRSSGLGECLFFLRWPSYSCCFLLLALCSASPRLSKKVTTAVPVAGCTSVCKKAWCRSPFLTISLRCNSCQLWTFFSFPFSFQHVIFLSWRPNLGTVYWFVPSQMLPRMFFFKWVIDFFINLGSDSF